MGRNAISFGLVLMTGYALVQTGQGQTAPSKGSPTAAEQAAALDAIRQYALNYTKNLPNYTCTQTTRETITLAGNHRQLRSDVVEE